MKTLLKAVPCVLIDIDTEPKILCFFEYPHIEGFQIPKGTVEENEELTTAVLRELFEETGIKNVTIKEKIGTLERICASVQEQELEDELQIWHLYHIEPKDTLKSTWEHIGTGNGVDNGLKVKCFWQALNSIDKNKHNEVFIRCFDMIDHYLKNK